MKYNLVKKWTNIRISLLQGSPKLKNFTPFTIFNIYYKNKKTLTKKLYFLN